MTAPDLAAFAVGSDLVRAVHYVPEYVDQATEERLITQISAAKAKWTQLSGRRLQNHGGIVHQKAGLIPTPLPRWLEAVAQELQARWQLFGPTTQSTGYSANHVLVNAYRPGEGILPHEDGPLYHPVVAILSLAAPVVLRFWRKQAEGGTGGQPPVLSLLLEPRSLLIFSEEAYTHCLHGIDEVFEETLDPTVCNLHLCSQLRTRPGQGAAAAAAVAAGGNSAACAAAAGAPVHDGSVWPTVPRTGERLSLTIRRVTKVRSNLLKLK